MNVPIKILHVEDVRSDADIVKREMDKSSISFDWRWVTNKADFQNALTSYEPDIILCDHSLPGFSSGEAIALMRKAGTEIPFILITATLSEEVAVMMMQNGINDYLLKDRIQRLPVAVTNALDKRKAEQEKAEYLKEIISNEARFRALIENNYDSITVRNKNLELLYRSPSANRMLGISEHDGYETPFYDTLHPEDVDEMRSLLKKAGENPGIAFPFSVRKRHRDEHYIWIEGTLKDLTNDPNIGGTIFNYRDITERMEANLQREKMTLQIMMRNNELEQFAYIVSHNLRAPVANILGISNVLGYEGLADEKRKRIISGITESAKRLDEVIRDLNLILQKKDNITEHRQRVVFRQLVDSIVETIPQQIQVNHVKLLTDFTAVDEIETVKSYLYSIFYNLITNSIKYRQPDVMPCIKIRSVRKQNRIELIFQDNGRGIDLDMQGTKVFGLYKRFHPEIEGKGLGLFMVKTQVEALGGSITITSKVNHGTTFTVQL